MSQNHIPFDAIRAQHPLLDTIERETGTKFHKVGAGWMGLCPLHNDSATPSLSVRGDHWTCFGGCPPEHSKGDVVDFIMAWKHMDLKEAVEYLGGAQGMTPMEIRSLSDARKEAEQKRLNEEAENIRKHREALARTKPWEQYHSALDVTARAAWRQNGIPDDWQDYWKLGYVPSLWGIGAAFSIPYFDTHKNIMTIQYRWVKPSDGYGKYVAEQDCGTFGFITRPDLRFDKLLLVEGAKKAAVSHLVGTSAQMQVIGYWAMKHLGGPEIDEIIRGAKAIWWWPDPGDEAVEWAKSHIERLGVGAKTKIVVSHMKPDDMLMRGLTSAGFSNILRTARRP